MFHVNYKFIILFLASFSTIMMAQIGQAQDKIDNSLREKLQLTKSKARVTQIIDGQTLMINNSEIIYLPAIYIPWEFTDSQGEYGGRAKKFLEKELLDKFIRIYQVRNNDRAMQNALGHSATYVVREDGWFAQQSLVEQGLAFAYPSQNHHVVADILYESENKARDNKVGFWADEKWNILSPTEANTMDMNRFVIVQGQVKKIANRNNVIYLNFGHDWREDFTVAMNSQLRRKFAKLDINIMQISGQTIRVRGWIRDYNGGYIEIFDPSQIELIEDSNNENIK